MSLGGALDLIDRVQRKDPQDLNAAELQLAGLTLAREVSRLQGELDRAKPTQGSRVAGWPLVERMELGGLRHYLGDLPVHAGTGLYLLTDLGWMPGRYEWSYKRRMPGEFYFSLPGIEEPVSCAIPDGARLAWPEEIESRHR